MVIVVGYGRCLSVVVVFAVLAVCWGFGAWRVILVVIAYGWLEGALRCLNFWVDGLVVWWFRWRGLVV